MEETTISGAHQSRSSLLDVMLTVGETSLSAPSWLLFTRQEMGDMGVRRMEKWSSGLLLTRPMLMGIMITPAWNSHSGLYCAWTRQRQFNTLTESEKKSRLTLNFVLRNLKSLWIQRIMHAHVHTIVHAHCWGQFCGYWPAWLDWRFAWALVPVCCWWLQFFPVLFVFFSTVSLAVQTTLKRPTLITLHFLCCTRKTDDYANLWAHTQTCTREDLQ